jgi:hypothetical protein
MKRLALLLLLVSVAHAASDVLLFAWQESRDEKTSEKQFGFFLAPAAVKKVCDADMKGDTKTVAALSAKLPKDAWMYGLLLTGESKTYLKENIALFEPSPCGSELKLDSGSVEVDQKAGTVRVLLMVKQDGKLSNFVGNGIYRIHK